MFEIILEKSSLIMALLLIFTVVTHDARLEYVSEIASAPTGTFAEEIYKAESIILADNSIARPSSKNSPLTTTMVTHINDAREAATKPRKEDKEKDGAIEIGVSYEIYANA